MKLFRTVLPVSASSLQIDYTTPICLIGSCFTEHVGGKLSEAKLPILQNPFGILYNPFSIAKSIERIIDNEPYVESDLIQQGGRWVSFDHHGRFAKVSASESLIEINSSLQQAHSFLLQAKILFISLGTAKVYEQKTSGAVVANCHKFPSNDFNSYLSEKEEVVAVLAQALKKLKIFNPNIQVVFTVSPVRHLKDGFTENQLSKATLLLAINDLRKKDPSIIYFPSYEILMDDLRDYRFYAKDLVHPSEEAIDYIFERFMDVFFQEDARDLRKQILKILAAVNHRPFNRESEEYGLFVKTTIGRMDELVLRNPFLSFQKEYDFLGI